MRKNTEGHVARLAEFARGARLSDVPADVIDLCQQRLVDGMAVLFAGVTQPPAKLAADTVRESGGHPRSTVIGAGFRTSPELAAQVNAIATHTLDWDDFSLTLMHPTAFVLPTVLALGEAVQSKGREVLEAFVIGVEVALRLARALNPPVYLRGFHPTGTIGTFGSVAAASRLLGLEQAQTEMAFGLGMAQAGGMFVNRGTMGKPFHAGNTARAGIVAAQFARRGYTASREVLADKFGVFDTILHGAEGTYQPEALSAGLNEHWEVRRDWALKPYPVGGARITLIEAAISLARTHDLDTREIDSVDLLVSPVIAHIDHARPTSWLDSRFSHPYCAAVALTDRRAGIQQFSAERFEDPALQALMGRIRVTADPKLTMDPTTGEGFPSTVVVRLRDGRTHRVEVLKAKGQDGRPTTWDDIREKYDSTATLVLPAEEAEQVWGLLRALERQDSLEPLMTRLMQATDRTAANGRKGEGR